MMFGLETLDLMIGLVTIYLTFGIAATASVEAVSSLLKLRANNLKAALEEMLSGNIAENEKLIDKFYENPLIQTLSQGKNGKPSYISKSTVSQVMESLLIIKGTAESLTDAINKMPDKDSEGNQNRVKALFQEFEKRTDGTVEKFSAHLEDHFDNVMERSTGWYKRKVQLVTLVISTILVVGGNVDTIEIAKTLASDPEARAQMLASATDLLESAEPKLAAQTKPSNGEKKESEAEPKKEDMKAVKQSVEAVNEAYLSISQALKTSESTIQIGWNSSNTPGNPLEWLSKFFGLLISIFAVSLGAPFWFNVLQNIAQLRSTGKPQATGKSSS